MELRNRATGAIITDSQLRAELPNTSLPKVLTPAILDELGYDPILEGAQATVTGPYQYSQRAGIEEINGQWFTKYIAGPVFTDYQGEDGNTITAAQQDADYRARKDEEQAKAVRTERNKKLLESDWRVTYEVEKATIDNLGIQFPLVWSNYRQALRDIPTQSGFPWQIDWPVEPS